MNELAGTTMVASEIDLREPTPSMAGARPSQLVRDLRVGRQTPADGGPATPSAPAVPEPAERLADRDGSTSTPAPPPAPVAAAAEPPVVSPDAPLEDAMAAAPATATGGQGRAPDGTPARPRLKPVPRLSDIVPPRPDDPYRR